MIDFSKLLFVTMISSVTQIVIYLFVKFLSKRGIKSDYFAAQKIHEGEVPRIGGLLFLSSFLITHISVINTNIFPIFPLLISCIIVFTFSFYEDLKQSLSPFFRLSILFIGSFVFVFFSELPEINVSFLISIKDNEVIKLLLFILSLMLLMNGFNFIDGLNGLSSFNFLSIICSVLYLGHFYNDIFIVNLSALIIVFAIVVFLLNFPFGKIFLGDSGSYVYALFSGALVIYLFERQSQLPTLLAMVILAYPITEMLFSIFRKILLKYSPLRPDVNHLHHLIFKKINGNLRYRNNTASLIMLPFCIIPFLLTYYSINYNLNNNFLKFVFYFIFYIVCYLLLFQSMKNIKSDF
tara:strand:+ start:35371 stop:36423 length:1053 start_codon:yes stop_codon:yes gene_type:complete